MLNKTKLIPVMRLIAVFITATLVTACQFAEVEPPSSPLLTGEPSVTLQPPAVVTEEMVTEEVRFPSGDLKLAGTLTLPAAPGPHPAVLFLTGSGPQDRDNAAPQLLPGYRPYRQLGDALARQGVASLRFDDRGVGDSDGEVATATSPELLAGAEAAWIYLREREKIDSAQIGVLGPSQGGIIAAMLAAAHPDVHFVAALATPALNGYETVKDALSRLAETKGLPPEQIDRVAERELHSMDLALAQDWDALDARLRMSIRENLEQIPDDQLEAQGDMDTFVDMQVNRALESYKSERFRDELTLDPAPAWNQVNASVLALYAEHETTVFPETHAPALTAQIAGLPDMTIATVPGVNHLFLEADDGNLQRLLQEAGQGARENMTDVPDRVVKRIVDWVVARVATVR